MISMEHRMQRLARHLGRLNAGLGSGTTTWSRGLRRFSRIRAILGRLHPRCAYQLDKFEVQSSYRDAMEGLHRKFQTERGLRI